MKLSIIVPIYNVAPYLHKCIDSLLEQDLPPEEYEIILVDDGSPDDCPAICDEYAREHENIRVIHRQNGGLSAARNSGIEIASGQYVQFVDSDDFLEPNVLKALVEKMDRDRLDVLRFNYQNVNEAYEVFEPYKVSKPFVDYRDEICDGLSFLTERLGFGCYACQFILRRDLMDGCSFKEGIYFEDTEWTPRMLLKAERVTSTDLMVYNYLFRRGSITHFTSTEKKYKMCEDRIILIDSLLNQMNYVDDKRWFHGAITQIALGVIGSVANERRKMRCTMIKRLRNKGIFPLSTGQSTFFAARKVHLANLSPTLLCLLLRFKSCFKSI